MMKPRPPKKKRRTLADVAQDIKTNVRAKKGTRKIKKTLKDSADKSSEKVKESRYDKLKKTSNEKRWKEIDAPGKEKRKSEPQNKEAGMDRVERVTAIRPTKKAERAKRKIKRMIRRKS